MNVQDPLEPTKRIIGALTMANCLIFYPILLMISCYTYELNFAVYSIALIVAYNIIEALCFFGWDAYNWPCTLTFCIILLLHDFAYLITFAVYAAFYDQETFALKVLCCFFFVVTFGINVATIVIYSKLPKSLCCGQMNSPSQPIFVNIDGQTNQLKNLEIKVKLLKAHTLCNRSQSKRPWRQYKLLCVWRQLNNL